MPIGGYVIRAIVDYSVEDHYVWYPGEKETPLPLGSYNPGGNPPFNLVKIPHEWEGSLVTAGRAKEYNFTIKWSDFLQIIVPDNDYSKFAIIGEGKLISLK